MSKEIKNIKAMLAKLRLSRGVENNKDACKAIEVIDILLEVVDTQRLRIEKLQKVNKTNEK